MGNNLVYEDYNQPEDDEVINTRHGLPKLGLSPLSGMKADANVPSREEVDRKFVESTELDAIPATELSNVSKWHILKTSFPPGYVFHSKYGPVRVIAERTVDGIYSGRGPYKVFLVSPVYALVDPQRGYNDPRDLTPVFYEVSQYAYLPFNRRYELFIFVHRLITRFVYDPENPNLSKIDLACIEDIERDGLGIQTTLEQIVRSKNQKDQQALEIFLRSYPAWVMQVDMTRIYLPFSEPTRQGNYVAEAKYIPVNLRLAPGSGTTDVSSLPPVPQICETNIDSDYQYDTTKVAGPDPNRAVEESNKYKEGGIDLQEVVQKKIQRRIGERIAFISSSRAHREHAEKHTPNSFRKIRSQIKKY